MLYSGEARGRSSVTAQTCQEESTLQSDERSPPNEAIKHPWKEVRDKKNMTHTLYQIESLSIIR